MEILNVPFLVNSYIRQKDKDNIVRSCKNFVLFCYKNDLITKSPFLPGGEFNNEIVLHETDLTESGEMIFEMLLDKWLAYTDRTQKYDDTSKLEKLFEKLKSK